MKMILKIFTAPIIITLIAIVWICVLAIHCSAFLLGLAGTIIGILGLLVLLTGFIENGVILLVIAFLISPLGLPMAAVQLLGLVQRLRYVIQDKVYG